MAFDLTANVSIRLVDVRRTAQQLKRQLSITAPVNIKFDSSANRNVKNLASNLALINKELVNITKNAGSAQSVLRNIGQSINTIAKSANNAAKAEQSMKKISSSTKEATSQLQEFGRISGLALRRNAGFVIATTAVFGFTRAVSQGVKSAIDFQKELVKVAQVSKRSISSLSPLTQEITKLSTELGVSSESLIEISVTLSQAGLSANQTRQALEALAKTSLAATFGDIQSTTEGAVAIMSQFGIRAKELESALSSVNAVAARFAVESNDIVAAVKRAGGVFAQTSTGVAEGTEALQQFVAAFTSVRATTRESSESIATGLRTIFTRIQRPTTIQYLRELGVELTDIQGKFVGPFEALNRLSRGFANVNPRSPIFASVIEELGGFRQVSKVIPLITEAETRLQALQVAQQGQTSLAEDAAVAQLSFANVLTKVREEFSALLREFTNTSSFRALLSLILETTKGLAGLARTLTPILPLLTAGLAFKGVQAARPFLKGFAKDGIKAKFARGGLVQGGSGVRDDVPADLMSGEFVVRKDAVKAIGVDRLNKLNRVGFASGGSVNASQLARDGIIGAALFKPESFDNDAKITIDPKKDNIRGLDRPRTFIYRREALDRADTKQIKGVLRNNILKGINEGSAILGSSDTATGTSGARLLRNLGEGQILGPLFEGILSNISQKGVFDKTVDPGRPFDFTRGLTGPLKSVFKNLANVNFIDAKYSAAGSEPARVRQKIVNQLRLGDNFSTEDSRRLSGLKKQQFGRKGLDKRQRQELRTLGLKRRGFATGGIVPSILTGGEFVLNRNAAARIGPRALNALNNADRVGFQAGGFADENNRYKLRRQTRSSNEVQDPGKTVYRILDTQTGKFLPQYYTTRSAATSVLQKRAPVSQIFRDTGSFLSGTSRQTTNLGSQARLREQAIASTGILPSSSSGINVRRSIDTAPFLSGRQPVTGFAAQNIARSQPRGRLPRQFTTQSLSRQAVLDNLFNELSITNPVRSQFIGGFGGPPGSPNPPIPPTSNFRRSVRRIGAKALKGGRLNPNIALAATLGASQLGSQIGGQFGAALSGGAGGAATGGFIGSTFGPVGTGVGAVLGGIIGAFTSFINAGIDEKLKTASDKMVASIGSIEDAISSFNKNGNIKTVNEAFKSVAGNILESNIAERASKDDSFRSIVPTLASGYLDLVQSGTTNNLKLQQRQQQRDLAISLSRNRASDLSSAGEAAETLFRKNLESTSGTKALESLTQGQAIALGLTRASSLGNKTILAELGDKSNSAEDIERIARQYLQNSFVPIEEESKKLRQAMQEAEQAVLENARGVSLMVERVRNLNAVLDRIDESGEGARRFRASILSRRSGGAGIISQQVINPFNNLRGRSVGEINQAASRFNTLAGNTSTSRELFNGVAAAKNLQSNLPRIINDLVIQSQRSGTIPERSGIVNAINSNFQDVPEVFRKTLIDRVTGRISDKQSSPLDIQRALQSGDISQDIESFTKDYVETSKKFVDVFNKNIAEYEQVLDKWVQLNREANDSADRILQTQLSLNNQVSSILNPTQRQNAARVNRGFFEQVNVLSRRAGVQGNVNIDSIAQQENRLNNLRQQAASDPNLDAASRLEIFRQLATKQEAANQALKLIADNTNYMASLQEDLNDVLDRRGATRRAAIEALTNPGQALRNRVLAQIGEGAAASGAPLPGQLLGQVLDAIDVRDRLAGRSQEQTFANQNAIIGNSGNFALLQALSPELNNNFARSGNRTGEDFFNAAAERAKFAREIGNAVGEQIAAQTAVARVDRRDANDFLTSGINQFNESMRQLNNIFSDNSILSTLNDTLGQLPEEIVVGGLLDVNLNFVGFDSTAIGDQIVSQLNKEINRQISDRLGKRSPSERPGGAGGRK